AAIVAVGLAGDAVRRRAGVAVVAGQDRHAHHAALPRLQHARVYRGRRQRGIVGVLAIGPAPDRAGVGVAGHLEREALPVAIPVALKYSRIGQGRRPRAISQRVAIQRHGLDAIASLPGAVIAAGDAVTHRAVVGLAGADDRNLHDPALPRLEDAG